MTDESEPKEPANEPCEQPGSTPESDSGAQHDWVAPEAKPTSASAAEAGKPAAAAQPPAPSPAPSPSPSPTPSPTPLDPQSFPPPTGQPPLYQPPGNQIPVVPQVAPDQTQGYPYQIQPKAARPLGFGARLGVGAGIGCAAQFIGLLFFLSLAATPFFFGSWWLSALVPIAAFVMILFAKTRPYAVGILIVSAAIWIGFLGPCLSILQGFG